MDRIDLPKMRRAIFRRLAQLDMKPAPASIKAGRNHNTLSDILTGKIKNPGILTLQDVADALEIPIGEMLGLKRAVK